MALPPNRAPSALPGYRPGVHDEWFLTDRQRGNPATQLPTWCDGSSARPLVHGSTYFARLADEVAALREGDHLFFTDWRGDADELLCPDGPTVAEAFGAAVERGVVVKGLMWRAHPARTQDSETAERRPRGAGRGAGGGGRLDHRG